MPLTGNVSRDIAELYHANKKKPKGKRRSRAQIIAIAMSKHREMMGKG